MSKFYTRIELHIPLPGPMAMEEPLLLIEKLLLEKQFPGVTEQIEQGCLWQND